MLGIDIPLPMPKKCTVTKWRYDFNWVEQRWILFSCSVTGCKLPRVVPGNQYQWDETYFSRLFSYPRVSKKAQYRKLSF